MELSPWTQHVPISGAAHEASWPWGIVFSSDSDLVRPDLQVRVSK